MKRLTIEDERLIADAKAERARLRLQQQIIRRWLAELSDRKLAEKFGVREWLIQDVA